MIARSMLIARLLTLGSISSFALEGWLVRLDWGGFFWWWWWRFCEYHLTFYGYVVVLFVFSFGGGMTRREVDYWFSLEFLSGRGSDGELGIGDWEMRGAKREREQRYDSGRVRA